MTDLRVDQILMFNRITCENVGITQRGRCTDTIEDIREWCDPCRTNEAIRQIRQTAEDPR